MIGDSKFHNTKVSVVLQALFLQIIIGFLCITVAMTCSNDQNLITYYLQNDMVTQTNPLTTCLSNQVYGIDTPCLSYYLNSTTNVYNCIQCDPIYGFPIMLDSGRNFCAFSFYEFYNLDCSLYTDSNPQFFTVGSVYYTIYQCKTCQNSLYNLISVQNFQHNLLLYFGHGQDVNLANKLCTALPLISGKTGGQECLIYEASTYQYHINVENDNLFSLVCGKCKTTAVSMDCSFACGANEFYIKYLSNGLIVPTCVKGRGTRGWDNVYFRGYTYACELYASYDPINHVLGGCITNIIADCQQYDPIINAKCIKCPENYYLNYQQNICIPLTLFCSAYLRSLCTRCIQPYELVNQTCILPTLPNCDVYNTSNGNCIKCQSQYFLNSLMRCDPYKVCANYQYLNTSINDCMNGQIQNCLTYFYNGIYCTQCQANYQIDSLGFSCKYLTPEVICPNNTNNIKYVISLGKCVQVDINCKYYLENGYCYQCLDGYYQFKGSCYSNSQTNNFLSSQITQCQNDQYLVGGSCIKIPSNCVFFDRQLNTCQVCAQRYTISINENNQKICTQVTN